MKIGFISLGCPKNLTDTEIMIGLLTEAGHKIVTSEELADILIVNTCAFIQAARDESNAEIQAVCKIKQQFPDKKIIVTGCMPQRDLVVETPRSGVYASVRDRFPLVDAVLGVNEIEKIVDVVDGVVGGVETPRRGVSTGIHRTLATPPYTAYLKISEGCDKKCTYCVIPAIRGSYHSRPIEEIVEEAELLVSRGVTEINLIAQDTTCYGIDLYGELALVQLLEKLEAIDGLRWIRLLYAYPEGITDELVQYFAKSDKLLHYLDMPLQHADDEILRKMGRKTRAEHVRQLVFKFREIDKKFAFRTTFIVGFPGETEEQFEGLCRFVKEIKFDRCGVFEYSKEEGTPAAKMAGQIEPKVKRERAKRVRQIQSGVSRVINHSFIGSIIEVLFTGPTGGRSFRDAPEIDGQVICSQSLVPGTIAPVKISHALTHDLKGRLHDTG